jgi:GxxExxY protein
VRYKYSDITGKVIGAAMEVHTILGNGFHELIYQRALKEEFRLREISFIREKSMEVFYKGKQVGTRRVDFFVEGIITVEIKAIKELLDIHLAQAINYLEAYNIEVGLLINFGANSLEYKRLTNKKFKC